MDTVLNSMSTRFVKWNTLYFDLSLLFPNNIPPNNIPRNSFLTLATKLKRFLNPNKGTFIIEELQNKLSEELLSFSKIVELFLKKTHTQYKKSMGNIIL